MNSETGLIDKIPQESQDLALHTDLCQQRYHQLYHKFLDVERRFANIENMMLEIKDKLDDYKDTSLNRYLAWAGVLILGMSGIITTILVDLIIGK